MEVGRLTGAFDLLTIGQLDVIEQARRRCDRLVARVRTDEQVERLEGQPPVMPLDERISLVAALRDVDDVDVASASDTVTSPSDARQAYLFARSSSSGAAEVLRPRPQSQVLPEVPEVVVRTGSRDPGLRIGYVPGGWDMFHVGHLRILERARTQCDQLVVGVATDEVLLQAKGRLPILPLAERAAVVGAVGLVDDVVVDTSSNKLLAWERVGFDVLFKGDDWRGTPKGGRLEEEMSRLGVELRYLPYTPHTSSTALRSVLDARVSSTAQARAASVVVGVPTYRRPEKLAALLPLLLAEAADLPEHRVRIVVVDNDPQSSARRVVEALHDDQVRYAQQLVPGIAAVRNHILDAATDELDADLVAMIDDDERPQPGWLAALVRTQERTGAALVAGRVVPEFAGTLDPWIAAGRFHTRRKLATGAPIAVAAAGNLLVDARQLRKLGQRFDEGFGLSGGEDTLFSRELHRRGGSLVWCAESIVVDYVLPERMTRRWVLARQMSHGDAWVRVELRLASGRARWARAALRARFVLAGSVRLLGGAARAVAGGLLARPVDQARGLRTAMRGIGMFRGACGLHHVEYARREVSVSP